MLYLKQITADRICFHSLCRFHEAYLRCTADGIHDPGTDALYKKGYQLYFYKNETTKKEIDVIIQKDGKIVPIEVKSGNTRANSLKSIMKNNKDISYGYKFIDGNVGTGEEGIITLPLYMIAFFDKVSE